GEALFVLRGHADAISVAVFSPDGQLVATASKDGTARLWDVNTGRELQLLNRRQSPPPQAGASASADTASSPHVPMNTQELEDHAKKLVPRCLSHDERHNVFLDDEPPAWCIEMGKWPYQTQDWKDWLRYKRADASPPLPDTPDWQSWLEAYQAAH